MGTFHVHRQMKGNVFKIKLIILPQACSSTDSLLWWVVPPSTPLLKLLHRARLSPAPSEHLRSATVPPVLLPFSIPIASVLAKSSPPSQVTAISVLGPSSPGHFPHCPQCDVSKISIWFYLKTFQRLPLLLAMPTSLALFLDTFLLQKMPMFLFEEMISAWYSLSPVLLCKSQLMYYFFGETS